ncbi:hypothetical protein ACIQB5_50370 [Streptomyces sp. NPDC088560]
MTGTGKPIPEVAEDLDMHPGALHSWVSRARAQRVAVVGPADG